MVRKLIAVAFALAATPLFAQGHFDTEAATRAYLATVNGAARAKSDAYFEGGYWILLWSFLIGAAADLAILHFGWSARLSAWSRRVTPRKFLQSLLYAAPYVVLSVVLVAPWIVYSQFVREHQYGMATQSFGPWFGEQLMSLAIETVVGALLIAGVMAMIRRTGRSWWAWATLIVTAGAFVGIVLAPVLIEPLFNKYTPMPASPLQQSILSMARANGVPADNVYVVDASRQTTRISANVAGLAGTTRVALNDNLLRQGTPDEVRAVMGHELGHYVLGHGYSLLVGFGLLFLAAFWATAALAPRLLARYGGRWGLTSMADPAVVPLLSILFSAAMLVEKPLENTLVRTHEAQADIFGLNVARAPDSFAKIALKLAQYRKLEPGPWEEAIFYDHPSGRSRIEMSMRWKAEHLGEAGVE